MKFEPIGIQNWSAIACNLQSQAQWEHWSQAPYAPKGDTLLKAESIPPLLRRRCSQFGKMCLETATCALADHEVDYVIFCSQHSDLSFTTELLDNICQQQILSPTKFTQSVHNTPAGLFSIMHKLTQNMTFISAGADTFFMALLECLSWLQTHVHNNVLVVMADNSIPKMYQALSIENNHHYAVSFLISNKMPATASFTVQLDQAYQKDPHKLPAALAFLAWYLQQAPCHFELRCKQQALTWIKPTC